MSAYLICCTRFYSLIWTIPGFNSEISSVRTSIGMQANPKHSIPCVPHLVRRVNSVVVHYNIGYKIISTYSIVFFNEFLFFLFLSTASSHIWHSSYQPLWCIEASFSNFFFSCYTFIHYPVSMINSFFFLNFRCLFYWLIKCLNYDCFSFYCREKILPLLQCLLFPFNIHLEIQSNDWLLL